MQHFKGIPFLGLFTGALICLHSVVILYSTFEIDFYWKIPSLTINLQSSSWKAVTLNLDFSIALVTRNIIKVLQTQVMEAFMDVTNYGTVSDLLEN